MGEKALGKKPKEKRVKCEVCGREWHPSVAYECKRKPGHYICRYCCGKCKWFYKAEVGTGCRPIE